MDFQQFGMTTINTAMIMAAILLLRDRLALRRRNVAEKYKFILDLKSDAMKHIPFWKRKNRKRSFVALGVIGVFMVWIGLNNIQAFYETLIMTSIAGAMVVYIRKLDDKKEIALYNKGILHKTGFLHFEAISDYTVEASDEYENAKAYWLLVGNTPRVQVHVASEHTKAFEKYLRNSIRLNRI
ncbi:hypothetical protein [Fusibacter sp. JL216-2]|uniref:hypothetical protein n=1 Tax=Fusibacter sp. JL216-2 TaxID=3071453 RepID=UPI003D32EB47